MSAAARGLARCIQALTRDVSKKGVKQHACKVRYAVRHLLRTGSTYRISARKTPA